MFYKLTLQEMLLHWRLCHGLLPIASAASSTASTPSAADTLLTAEIEAWYDRMLLTAPERLIDTVDYAARISLPSPVEGGVTFTLPADAVRLLSVRLSGWWCDARIISDTDKVSEILLMQRDPYTRATPFEPVALLRPGGFVSLYPVDADTTLESFVCAARHEDGLYHFHPSLLPLNNLNND